MVTGGMKALTITTEVGTPTEVKPVVHTLPLVVSATLPKG